MQNKFKMFNWAVSAGIIITVMTMLFVFMSQNATFFVWFKDLWTGLGINSNKYLGDVLKNCLAFQPIAEGSLLINLSFLLVNMLVFTAISCVVYILIKKIIIFCNSKKNNKEFILSNIKTFFKEQSYLITRRMLC